MKRKKLLSVLIFAVVVFLLVGSERDFKGSVKPADTKKGWQLIVVNRNYCVPESWVSEFVTLSCGEKVDERIYPDLQDMFDDALLEGVDLVVRSGYRSEEEQEQLMLNKISSFRMEGYSKREAEEKAQSWVSSPGTSEHQLGIAVDINAENGTKDETAYKWLSDHAHEYGFIVRYPADKSHITGISYEPWHFRYVGKKHAERIFERGLCLEEYVEIL